MHSQSQEFGVWLCKIRPILPHFPAVDSAECIANLWIWGLAMHDPSDSTSFSGQRQRQMHSQSLNLGVWLCMIRPILPHFTGRGGAECIANLWIWGLAMHDPPDSTSFSGGRQRRMHSHF